MKVTTCIQVTIMLTFTLEIFEVMANENCVRTFSGIEDALYVIGGKWRLKIIIALFDEHAVLMKFSALFQVFLPKYWQPS